MEFLQDENLEAIIQIIAVKNENLNCYEQVRKENSLLGLLFQTRANFPPWFAVVHLSYSQISFAHQKSNWPSLFCKFSNNSK